MTARMPRGRNGRDKRSLTRRIYDALRADLLSCVLPPGAQLFEGDLAARYKVSKTPVREALNSLRQEGLVRVLPRRGYEVTAITLRDINALLELRFVLEAGAVDLAVRHLTSAGLERLEHLARASYKRGDRQSEAEFVAANRAFHLAFAELSGNQRLVDLIARCLDELQRVFHLGAGLRNITDEVAQDHLDLVAALQQRDTADARRIVAAQIAHTRANILRALAGGTDDVTQQIRVESVRPVAIASAVD
jgi:DNA-binding GntR family transcriptional regulator